MNPFIFPSTDQVECLRTVRDFWRLGLTCLQPGEVFFGHGYPGPEEESRHLLLYTLALPQGDITPWLDACLLPAERQQFLTLLRRRIEERIPMAYLTQEAWLGPYRFFVDERALIPRSFIAEALEDGLDFLIDDFTSLQRVADVCTGGGSLAILLALKCPQAQVDATDLSVAALAVATRNLHDYGLEEHIHLLHGDLCEKLMPSAYDLIISNPPYVDGAAMSALPAEYAKEPVQALASGPDGLDHIRRILAAAPLHLTANGLLVVEVGHQADVLEHAFPHLPFIWLDLSGGSRQVFALSRDDLVNRT